MASCVSKASPPPTQVSPATAVESTKPLMEQLTFTALGTSKGKSGGNTTGIGGSPSKSRPKSRLWNIYICVHMYIIYKYDPDVYVCTYT